MKLMIRKGTTLVELLIVIVVLAIMMTTFSSIYANGIKNFREELAQTQLQSDAQTVLDRIIGDIKLAQGIDATYNTFVTNSDTIILKVPAIDQYQNFIYSGATLVFDRIIYYKSNSELHRIVYADTSSARFATNNLDKTLSSNLSIFTLTYQPDITTPTAVTTTIKLSKYVGKINRFVTVTSKAKFRNNL